MSNGAKLGRRSWPCDCIPTGMELFPAAGRYGSKGQTGRSYTEMEYDYAAEAGLPVLVFPHKDAGTIPANNTEATNDGKAALSAFRNKIEKVQLRAPGLIRQGKTQHDYGTAQTGWTLTPYGDRLMTQVAAILSAIKTWSD